MQLCFQWKKLVQRNKVSWLSDERFLPVNNYNSLTPLEGSPPCGEEPSRGRGGSEYNEEQPVHLSPSEEGTFCWHLSCANKRSGVSVERLAGKMNDNSSPPRLMVSAKFIINALTHCLTCSLVSHHLRVAFTAFTNVKRRQWKNIFDPDRTFAKEKDRRRRTTVTSG